MGKITERIVNAERVEDLMAIFGSFDENIRRIEEALTVIPMMRSIQACRVLISRRCLPSPKS